MLRLGDKVRVRTRSIQGEGIVTALDVPHPDCYHPDADRPGVRVRVGSHPHTIFATYEEVRHA